MLTQAFQCVPGLLDTVDQASIRYRLPAGTSPGSGGIEDFRCRHLVQPQAPPQVDGSNHGKPTPNHVQGYRQGVLRMDAGERQQGLVAGQPHPQGEIRLLPEAPVLAGNTRGIPKQFHRLAPAQRIRRVREVAVDQQGFDVW